uniref:Uncharacterized protein n=1 Tax=Panagrellus redivivus TaxID=6233 RepID=A0A7E4ZZ47_PANRE
MTELYIFELRVLPMTILILIILGYGGYIDLDSDDAGCWLVNLGTTLAAASCCRKARRKCSVSEVSKHPLKAIEPEVYVLSGAKNTQRTNPDAPTQTMRWLSNTMHVSDTCKLVCPMGQTEFTVEGQLRVIKHPRGWDTVHGNGIGQPTVLETIRQLGDHFYYQIMTVLCVAIVAAFLILALI